MAHVGFQGLELPDIGNVPDATALCGQVRRPRREAATNMFWSQLG
jgi:hypothetical protein